MHKIRWLVQAIYWDIWPCVARLCFECCLCQSQMDWAVGLCLQHCTLASAHLLGEIRVSWFRSAWLSRVKDASRSGMLIINVINTVKNANKPREMASCTVQKTLSIITKSDVLKPSELDTGQVMYFLLLIREQRQCSYNLQSSQW